MRFLFTGENERAATQNGIELMAANDDGGGKTSRRTQLKHLSVFAAGGIANTCNVPSTQQEIIIYALFRYIKMCWLVLQSDAITYSRHEFGISGVKLFCSSSALFFPSFCLLVPHPSLFCIIFVFFRRRCCFFLLISRKAFLLFSVCSFLKCLFQA